MNNLEKIYNNLENITENRYNVEESISKYKFEKLIFQMFLDLQNKNKKKKDDIYYSIYFDKEFCNYNEIASEVKALNNNLYLSYKDIVKTYDNKSQIIKNRLDNLKSIIEQLHCTLSSRNFTLVMTKSLDKNRCEVELDEKFLNLTTKHDKKVIICKEQFPLLFNTHSTKLLFADIPGGKLYHEILDRLDYNQDIDIKVVINALVSFINANILQDYFIIIFGHIDQLIEIKNSNIVLMESKEIFIWYKVFKFF